uniref:VWFD domain-containing protein n=1 Tax=Timema genevievae TaxID=629358 RepID=A0A7R9JYK4_TIMGE|nr:unnamed protein product [Timema genevievae]
MFHIGNGKQHNRKKILGKGEANRSRKEIELLKTNWKMANCSQEPDVNAPSESSKCSDITRAAHFFNFVNLTILYNDQELEINLDNHKVIHVSAGPVIHINKNQLDFEENQVVEVFDLAKTTLVQISISLDRAVASIGSQGRLCGLCGGWTGETETELRDPGLSIIREPQLFGESYKLKEFECQEKSPHSSPALLLTEGTAMCPPPAPPQPPDIVLINIEKILSAASCDYLALPFLHVKSLSRACHEVEACGICNVVGNLACTCIIELGFLGFQLL